MAKDRWPDLCELVRDDDGLPVRTIGPWTEDKLWYWNRYVEITTVGMSRAWPNGLCYIDLFAGSGVCERRDNRQRVPGSALLAARAPVPFRSLILVEKDPALAVACESRVRQCKSGLTTVTMLNQDCNDAIDQVIQAIPVGALSLAFVDPESLQVRFNTLRTLASRGKVDLLVLLPTGYDIVRNIALYELQDDSKLDRVLGTTSWRQRLAKLENRQSQKIIDFFSDEYTSRLRDELGYQHVDVIPIKHNNTNYYNLVYASEHPQGLNFWRKAVARERTGQLGLGF